MMSDKKIVRVLVMSVAMSTITSSVTLPMQCLEKFYIGLGTAIEEVMDRLGAGILAVTRATHHDFNAIMYGEDHEADAEVQASVVVQGDARVQTFDQFCGKSRFEIYQLLNQYAENDLINANSSDENSNFFQATCFY